MLRRRCLRTAFAGGLAAAILCTTPALAAPPPTAGDDTITARPRGTTDVLANDTGTGIRVTATGAPAHGSATCSDLGACLYKADAGYTGSDEFSYTLTDSDGSTATGKVTVTVVASVVSTALVPTDDDIATKSGHAVSVDVTANDSGKAPLTVSAPTTPSHGTATCETGGRCTYTPADGFTGSDGFRYTVKNGDDATDTADVHVLVIAADTAYGPGVDGGANPVAAGGSASWLGRVTPNREDLALEELAALSLPELTTSLAGPHAMTAGSAKGAKGWTVGDGGIKATATGDALLGDAITEAFPKPLPPISQGTGGDGHVPILVGSRVFAVFHHNPKTSISCVDRRTGAGCPGYPIALDAGSSNINGPGVVVGTKIYMHLWPHGYYGSGYTQSAPVAVFCWDTQTNDTCGWTILDRVGTPEASKTGNPGASHPVRAGNRLFVAADTGKLYCRKIEDLSPCATPSIDTGLPTTGDSEYDIIAHGSRVFIGRKSQSVACVDVDAGGPCAGWPTPKTFAGSAWNVINQHDASGAIIGVCVVANYGGTADCLPDADPSSPTHVTTFPPFSYDYYNTLQEAETGTRTFMGSLSRGGLACFDWSTMAPCAGPRFGPDGWVTTTTTGGGLPSAYGAAWDGSCAVAVGDPGQVFTVDAAGNSPCTSLSSGTNRRTVDLRDQRCDGGVGAAAWRKVTLGDIKEGELTSVIVTIRDAETDQVLASGDLVKDGPLDLSGIDPGKHPKVSLDANAQGASAGAAPAGEAQALASRVAVVRSPWDDSIPPRLRLTWKADPQQLCFTTKPAVDCATPTDTTVNVTGHLLGAADVTKKLGVSRPAGCSPVAAAGTVPAACRGLRFFRIHVRYAGQKIRRLTVTANGKKQKVLTLKGRPIARVDLKGLPTSTVKVRITIRTKSGKTLKGTRIYHPCTKRLPNRGFKY